METISTQGLILTAFMQNFIARHLFEQCNSKLKYKLKSELDFLFAFDITTIWDVDNGNITLMYKNENGKHLELHCKTIGTIKIYEI